MQGIMETAFDLIYLTTVISLGLIMIQKSEKKSQFKLFGMMALILGLGDAFHLIPRAYALLTIGLEANATALGLGKLITSISMTIFYVILYIFWRKKYDVNDRKYLSNLIYSLAVIRITLCLFPQNDWFNFNAGLDWGIIRNIPFAIMGLIILVLYYQKSKLNIDKDFKYMWFAIALSFAFYVPVVLWAKSYSWVGMLMIPKTLAYVWIVFMGYNSFKENIK